MHRRDFAKSAAALIGVTAGCTSQQSAGTTEEPESTELSSQKQRKSVTHLHDIAGETYPPVSDTNIRRYFEWDALDTEWSMSLDIESSYADYYENRFGRNPDFSSYVFEAYGDPYIDNLAEKFRRSQEEYDLSERELIDLSIGFVQSLKYTEDDVKSPFDQYTYYPLETLINQGGDCEDSSIFMARFLNALGYDNVLLKFTDRAPRHMAVGVLGNDLRGSYYEYNGREYYYLETTGSGYQLGQVPDSYQGRRTEIIPFERGPTFVYNYETVVRSSSNVELNTTISNYGATSGLNIKYQAQFEDRAGRAYPFERVSLGRVVENETETYNQILSPPDDRELQLVTRMWDDETIFGRHTSDWRKSPN
jgi:hypothetical protein